MNAESFARVAEAVAALVWPVLALVIVIALLPVLREIVRRRQFTIKVAGFELSAQEATDQLKDQIEDLQAQVAALATAGGAPAETLAPPPESVQEGRTRAERILWVDDIPSNNALMIDAFQRMGLGVETATSTDEGLALLSEAPSRYLVVISDLGRTEGGSFRPQAGTALVRKMREAGFEHPVAINTSSEGVRNGQPALAAGADLLTSSATELRRFVERHLENGRADQLHP